MNIIKKLVLATIFFTGVWLTAIASQPGSHTIEAFIGGMFLGISFITFTGDKLA